MAASAPPPPPLVSCGCGFIVASAPLTPASHLAGEAVASWDLPTQPGNGSVKIRRLSHCVSNLIIRIILRNEPRKKESGPSAGSSGERHGRGVCRRRKVAVAPWVGSRLRLSPNASPRGAGPLTEFDVADGASQVLLGHNLADDHQQVELAVEEAMRQAGRGRRRRADDAAGRLRLGGFHHHGRHPAGLLCLGEVPRSGRSSPLRQEKGLSPKVQSPLRPLRLPSSWRCAPPPPPPSPRARGGEEWGVREGGEAAPLIWRLGREPGRRRKRRRQGPPGTSSRGGCLRSSSRWPRADVICSKSSRPRPGSWRDEMCGQWSGQGRESSGRRTLRGENTPNLHPTPHPPPAANPHPAGAGEWDVFPFSELGYFTLSEVHKSGLCLMSCLR